MFFSYKTIIKGKKSILILSSTSAFSRFIITCIMMIFKIAATVTGSWLKISSWCQSPVSAPWGATRWTRRRQRWLRRSRRQTTCRSINIIQLSNTLVTIIFLLIVWYFKLKTEHRMTNLTSWNSWYYHFNYNYLTWPAVKHLPTNCCSYNFHCSCFHIPS